MYIKKLLIVLEPHKNDSENTSPKQIIMDDNQWELPKLYPREIRLISSLEAIIKEFNRNSQ